MRHLQIREEKARLEEKLQAAHRELADRGDELSAALQARRVMEASVAGTRGELSSSMEREAELSRIKASREATVQELEHRLAVAEAIVAEHQSARAGAERETDEYRARLDNLVSVVSLHSPSGGPSAAELNAGFSPGFSSPPPKSGGLSAKLTPSPSGPAKTTFSPSPGNQTRKSYPSANEGEVASSANTSNQKARLKICLGSCMSALALAIVTNR